MVYLSSLEKSMELRSIKKAKEKLDVLSTKECLTSKDIEYLNDDEKTLEKLRKSEKRRESKYLNIDKNIS